MYGGYDGPRGPPRAGIGAEGAAQNLPVPNLPNGAGDAGPVEKFSLFVGGVPPSLSDNRLHEILETVGQVLKVNRVRGPDGKPKGFGFVEYGDPEAVLRCIELLNGVSIVGKDREQKSLIVKPDKKLKERLDEHEAGRMKTSQLDDQTAFARDQLADLLDAIRKNPTEGAEPAEDDGIEYNPDGTRKYKIPSHLQDLGPDDLPEESRGLVTSEIAKFRVTAAKREEQKRLAEAQRDRARREEYQRQAASRQPAPAAYSPRNDQGRFASQAGPSQPRSWGQRSPPRGPAQDSYRQQDERSMGFVASSSNAPPQQNGMSDEDAERRRQQLKREDNERQYRQRLRTWELREKGKIQGIEKDKQAKFYEQQDNDRRRQRMLEKCTNFDDEAEAEHGDELFIVDRTRWRKARQQARQRELEQDARDAQVEAEQAEALRKQSEAFLNRQAELFASMAGTSIGNSDAPAAEPKKMTLLAPSAKTVAADGDKARAKPKAPAVFAGAEEDEDSSKKKRELIPLSYSDDEDDDRKAEKKKRKVKELVSAIPTDKDALWQYEIRWDKFSEAMVSDKLRPFVAKKSVEYLGSEEEEVIDTVIENMRAHKGPQELADELEPVLAEEAEEFVIKVYRMLNFELLSALHGVKL